MIHVSQAVIVEGRYDKIRLSSLIDALIVEVGGFGIFKDREKSDLIAHLAKTRGIIVLTDSDAAGFKIRNRIKNIAREGTVYHGYIPDILGKEKRKQSFSAEGKLGVEGMETQVLTEVFERIGIKSSPTEKRPENITVTDLFECGLTGGHNSGDKKKKLLKYLKLPEHLSTSMLIKCMDGLITKDELYELYEFSQKNQEPDEKI